LVWASGSAVVDGEEGNDFLIHTGSGELRGGDGNDWLVALLPDFHFQGDFVDTEIVPSADGEVDERERYLESTYALLHGGEGNDNLFSFGGRGAHLIGGAGEDLLFSAFTERAQLWGNDLDTEANQGESDMFWWSPGAFIMDADPVDFVSMFGLPLVGGSSFFGGVVLDSVNWSFMYAGTKSGQLVIINWVVAAILGIAKNGDIDWTDFAMG